MKKYLLAVMLVVVGGILGLVLYHFFLQQHFSASTTTVEQPIQAENNKPLYWVAPMDPKFRRESKGKSPMGMDLVPVYADDIGDDNAVIISSAVEQSLGVRTALVSSEPLSKALYTVGYVEPDETLISHIHSYTEGWIKQLYANTTGETVEKGQLLYDLYSLPLMNAQQEYLVALATEAKKAKGTTVTGYSLDAKTLVDATRKKLLALGVTDAQIKELRDKKTINQRVRVLAPQSGVLSELNIRQGMYVTPKLNIMTIVDLSTIWVIADFFEQDVNWVKPGLKVEATLPYMPNRTWEGVIDYIYPQLDPKTRSLRVRLVFDNPDGFLMPGMYADVRMQSVGVNPVLTVPQEAVIRTGNETRVILALGNGRYRAVPVKTGLEGGEQIEIISGVKKDDRVVISAQFLLDSEASLKASFSRLKSPAEIKDNQGTAQVHKVMTTKPLSASNHANPQDSHSSKVRPQLIDKKTPLHEAHQY